jgi:2,3-bisphosphoglycerate-independent phosphoglycerate mutase
MPPPPKPILLLILDGWGVAEANPWNAITTAKTPYWDFLWKNYPHTLLEGSGLALGLPYGQIGNSEVGHMTLGAGRIVYQDLVRINQAIENDTFFKDEILLKQLNQIKVHKKAIHVMGLLSKGGVHSHEHHIQALLARLHQLALKPVYIHAFLDGRDTPPQSAKTSLEAMETLCRNYPDTHLVSLIGRYYAMDRDLRWERTQKAYALITQGKATRVAPNSITGLETAYIHGQTDEFVEATRISGNLNQPVFLEEGDLAIFMNFRADRAKQLSQALIDPNFTGFKRSIFPKIHGLISLTHYGDSISSQVVFPPQHLTNTLGEILSQQRLKQLRLAETEKYAHVTYFFNGGVETPFSGETRCLIPSPKVTTYNLQPAMHATQVTRKLLAAIQAQQHDVIICNFANPDMVGHTGDFRATVQAIEVIDQCLSEIIPALQKVGGEAIITADHGNAELLYDTRTQQAHTAHTCAPVPCIYIGRPATLPPITTSALANLSAIAPTLLHLLGLPKPQEMTGINLVHFL